MSETNFGVRTRKWRVELKHELVKQKSNGVKYVKVITSQDSNVCDECKILEGKTYPIDEAISKMPIPVNCKHGLPCRCVYSYSFEKRNNK